MCIHVRQLWYMILFIFTCDLFRRNGVIICRIYNIRMSALKCARKCWTNIVCGIRLQFWRRPLHSRFVVHLLNFRRIKVWTLGFHKIPFHRMPPFSAPFVHDMGAKCKRKVNSSELRSQATRNSKLPKLRGSTAKSSTIIDTVQLGFSESNPPPRLSHLLWRSLVLPGVSMEYLGGKLDHLVWKIVIQNTDLLITTCTIQICNIQQT